MIKLTYRCDFYVVTSTVNISTKNFQRGALVPLAPLNPPLLSEVKIVMCTHQFTNTGYTMHVDGFTTFLMTVFLSMGGSWYLQNNLTGELKGQLMEHITGHAKELFELQ